MVHPPTETAGALESQFGGWGREARSEDREATTSAMRSSGSRPLFISLCDPVVRPYVFTASLSNIPQAVTRTGLPEAQLSLSRRDAVYARGDWERETLALNRCTLMQPRALPFEATG
ncbi:MAG: hypothetical protein OWU84_05165 [Firmicutes bacterium]|nr:hypothetical protein [Bacillota bacterium]